MRRWRVYWLGAAGAAAVALGAALFLGDGAWPWPRAKPPRPARGAVLVFAAGLGPDIDAETTPVLARLAASGRRFVRAYAPEPDAEATRSAIVEDLSSTFGARGVAMARVGPVVTRPSSGEEVWDLSLSEPLTDAAVARRLGQWLRAEAARPFVLVASVGPSHDLPLRTHPAPDPDHRASALPRIVSQDLGFADRPGGVVRPFAWSDASRRRAEAEVLGRAVEADGELGRLLQVLEDSAVADDVAIVVLGDPLPDLGQHGLLARPDTLFDSALRVGLVITAPGLHRPGRPSMGLVSSRDVTPTLLGLAGLAPAPSLDAANLLPLLADPGATSSESVLSSVQRKAPQLGRSLRTARYRLTEWPDGSDELYDHAQDPHEIVNLVSRPERGETVEALRQAVAIAESRSETPSEPRSREHRPRNVLLILVDDLTPRLGAWGAPVLTPNLDRLAAAGVRFERAYVQVAMCSPSRVSLFTGWRPERTGVWTNVDPPRPSHARPLQEHFHDHGYFTASVGKVLHQPQVFEWDWRDATVHSPHEEVEELGDASPAVGGRGDSFWEKARGGDATQPDGLRAREAARLLRQRRSRPFFMAVGFVRPHLRWIAPAAYFDLYPPDTIALSPVPADDLADVPAIAVKTKRQAIPGLSLLGREPGGVVTDPSFRRQAIAAYQACVSFVDAQIGLLLRALDDRDLWRDTVVVLAGDNGFHLGEHGGLYRKDTLFEEALRVPLIVVAPDLPQPGAIVSGPVGLIDLYPTIVDLAGVPTVGGLDGRSLRPFLEHPERAVEGGVLSYRRVRPPGRAWSLRTDRMRYSLWPDGSEELYDHRTDADERENRAELARYAEIKARLRAQLEERVAGSPSP